MTPRLRILAAAVAVSLSAASAAEASCVPMTPAEQRAHADVIFIGVALDGVTASGLERFRVSRYIKGTGPKIIRVLTGRKRNPDGTGQITSVSIDAKRGEAWRIYGIRVRPGVFETNVCLGSRRVRR